MAFQEFYCDAANGNNLNGGSDSGSPSATDTASTYGRGTGAGGVDRITASAGTPFSGAAVGQYVGVKANGGTAPLDYCARVLAVNGGGTSIDVADGTTNTASFGTRPADSASVDCKVGGAWKGPNAASGFPFNVITNAAVDGSSNSPRVNFKNGTNYAITAAMTHTLAGPIRFEGYSSSPGDGGRATIDGGTSGTSYVLLTVSTAGSQAFVNLIFQNNGNSGTSNGVTCSVSPQFWKGCVFHDVRGHGLQAAAGLVEECEAYNCSQGSNSLVGFREAVAGCVFLNCYAHDITGTGLGVSGFQAASGQGVFVNCIADTINGDGFELSAGSTNGGTMINCDSYNNARDGARLSNTDARVFAIINCNFVKNAGWGINGSGSGGREGVVLNCGFGSGSDVNTSGTTTGLKGIVESGDITYSSPTNPYNAPTTGDFRIVTAAARSAGRGIFVQTGNSKTGSVAYPDVGACQHIDTGARFY